TASTDFPTANAEQPALGGCDPYAGCLNAFVTKFDPTGKTLIYSTYLGGSRQDQGGAIAVDSNGNAIVAGIATSSNFPQAGAISSPACQINNNCYFLASLKPDGAALNYSGMIGGEQGFATFGLGGDLAVDASGNAYLAGTTENSNFQITAGTLATSVVGYPYNETFVLKVDPTGKLVYSTVIPGNDTNSTDLLQPYTNDFVPSGIAVDAAGDVTIAGTAGLGLTTTSGVVGSQFPNAYVNVENASAGFVLQLNPTASAINFASYLPGTDYGRGLAVDAVGNFYLTGGTQETNLPISANAYQKAPVKIPDGQIEGAYVMVLNPKATAILGATYLGAGAVGGYGFTAVALDSHDNIFVGGNGGG
ncbi:MAG: SBBP repeat-containing protein, partial [Acidobacteriota bacterium]